MRILLVFAFALCCASAYESYASYEVSYSFLTLGEAEAYLKKDENGTYESSIYAKATGFAGVMSGHREERYKSVGRVVDGMLMPEQFESRTKSDKKSRYFGVFFDLENDNATVIKENCREEKCTHESLVLADENYTAQDILTLYHNLTAMFVASGGKRIETKAVGSKKPVVIEVPEGKKLKTAKELLKKEEGTYLLVLLNQEIFTSDTGELYVNLDKDNIVKYAVLKDTFLFGDVRGKLIKKKITP
ncbi:MAG: DUF3108 domain-containing protein [Helicobacteraceae bacterium]|jgi:hypothetical protein|nr:DUF3108 domain-containing protein [Helicobacteraceae bacterium]